MNRYARGKSTLISNMVNFLDDINILIVNIDLFTVSNNQTSLFDSYLSIPLGMLAHPQLLQYLYMHDCQHVFGKALAKQNFVNK